MTQEDRCRHAKSELLSMWRLQEHLLHVYHTAFIALNSVLLAVVTFSLGIAGSADVTLRTLHFSFFGGRPYLTGVSPVSVSGGSTQAVARIPEYVIPVAIALCIAWIYLYWDRALAASFFPQAIEALEQECKDGDEKCFSAKDKLQTPFLAFKAARREPEGAIHLCHPIKGLSGIKRTQFKSKPRMILGLIPLLTLGIWCFLAYSVFH